MTISGFGSYGHLSLYGTSANAAASGFAQLATASGASSDSSNSTIQSSQQSLFGGSAREAAEAKLKSIDPQLAQKMDDLHSQIDQMVQSGASQEDIGKAMEANMDSLSDTEKSELQSVFGAPPQGGPGGADATGTDPLASLQQTDPTLAKKLEDFKSQVDQLRQSGASDDTIAATMKKNMDSLSDSEKSEMQSALAASRPHHHHGQSSEATSTGASSAIASFLQAQGSSAYAQSQALLAGMQNQSLAFAA
ncbi:MAG TPA: hypothetical protein VHE55_11790 [Fimbriimonadaceae bacterium]|nr:hypothetical protein [Fimbriimonadaceae bacterium]